MFVWGHVLPRHNFVYFVVDVDAIYINVDVAKGGPSLLILPRHNVVDVAAIDGDVVVAEGGPGLLVLPRHGQHQRCHLPLKGEDTKG